MDLIIWDCQLLKKHARSIVQASNDLRMRGYFLIRLNARRGRSTLQDTASSVF